MPWPNPSLTRWMRTNTRPVIEDGLTLDIHRVVKLSKMKPGQHCFSGSLHWSRNGRITASIGYRLWMDTEDTGELFLDFSANEISHLQRFVLIGTPCRYGGRRWLAICPETGVKVSKFVTCGGALFRSRKALGAAYRVQCESPINRIFRRRNKVLDRLESSDPDYQPKPKWMRKRTYRRLQKRVSEARSELGRFLLDRYGITQF